MIDDDMRGLVDRSITYEQTSYPFRRVCLYGAGGRGRAVARRLLANGVEVVRFFDSDQAKAGTAVFGIEVLGPEELDSFRDVPLLVTSRWQSAIITQLRAMGATNDIFWMRVSNYFTPDYLEDHRQEIETIHGFLADDESRRTFASAVKAFDTGNENYHLVSPYPMYAHPNVRPRPGDVIVDAGGWIGDTVELFLAGCPDCRMHVFEPDPAAYGQLTRLVEERRLGDRVRTHRQGLWETSGTAAMRLWTDGAGSTIVQGLAHAGLGPEATTIDVVSLDDFAEQHGTRIDFIKMDIEGAELAALRGASRTIQKCKPRLAICLYHQVSDLTDIPLYVKSLVPEYKIYIGHHGTNEIDTILYATTD